MFDEIFNWYKNRDWYRKMNKPAQMLMDLIIPIIGVIVYAVGYCVGFISGAVSIIKRKIGGH